MVDFGDDFKSVDARVREYLSGGQDLMAADVVYTEGGASLVSPYLFPPRLKVNYETVPQ